MPVRPSRSRSFETRHTVIALAIAWTALGCGGESSTALDAGSATDAGLLQADAGGNAARDSGMAEVDAGRAIDAGQALTDAGLLNDAGTSDAGSGADCTGTPWGTVQHGFSAMAYLNRVASRGTSCAGTSQIRTCTNGTMSGTYIQTSCTQYPCEYMGARFADGARGFTSDMAPAQFLECTVDGSWSGPHDGDPSAVSQPCAFGDYYVEHGTCGYAIADGRTYRCVSGTLNPDTSCPVGP